LRYIESVPRNGLKVPESLRWRLISATDELVASLTTQLNYQQDSVNPAQVKSLETKGALSIRMCAYKVKSLQEELRETKADLASVSGENELLIAKLAMRNQSTAQAAQDLLSDLSGLLFRNIERANGTTTFDCLQCGRNGSILFPCSMVNIALHYKLSMEDNDVNDPHGQIVYSPMLDPSRDEKILKVLPDYLTDEIMFSREQGPFTIVLY
jgi:hypothetical protein